MTTPLPTEATLSLPTSKLSNPERVGALQLSNGMPPMTLRRAGSGAGSPAALYQRDTRLDLIGGQA